MHHCQDPSTPSTWPCACHVLGSYSCRLVHRYHAVALAAFTRCTPFHARHPPTPLLAHAHTYPANLPPRASQISLFARLTRSLLLLHGLLVQAPTHARSTYSLLVSLYYLHTTTLPTNARPSNLTSPRLPNQQCIRRLSPSTSRCLRLDPLVCPWPWPATCDIAPPPSISAPRSRRPPLGAQGWPAIHPRCAT